MRATCVGDVSVRFHQRYVVDEVTGCWNWTGRCNPQGYGQISGAINGKFTQPWTSSQFVTMTGSDTTAGMVGNVYIHYVLA